MNRLNNKIILLLITFLLITQYSNSANIVRPWRSTTAIVVAGEDFEVWFNADEGQSIVEIILEAPYSSGSCSFSVNTGDWEYDPLSGNRFNREILVTVPVDLPEDRYDLVIRTNAGDVISYGGVKVLKDYKSDYYVMHISDGHLYQNGYDVNILLAKKTAMIEMADIMDCQLIIETGDNMYNVRNHPEREVMYFLGNEEMGFKGMSDATAATFLVPGDHDAYKANDWPQASVEVNSDFFNDYWGLQNSNFIYGSGRYMMLNNAWAVSESNGGVHEYQADEAVTWLQGDGAGGDFFVTAGHCYNKLHEFINDDEPLDLVLAGDKHHIRTNNPYSFDEGSDELAYIAGSIREHFEFNLFRISNETGTFTTVSGTNAVVEVLNSGDQSDVETWVPNLSIEYQNNNNGNYFENTATINNRFDFPIEEAKIRFVMPAGFDYRIGNGEVFQDFSNDEYRVIDVVTDVNANSTIEVTIGDADLCPDDPDKTEPGLCGCGVEEGTCEPLSLTVNNGSGAGNYYPYEKASIAADAAVEGELFDSWEINAGSPLILDPNDPSTEIILQGNPAEITATYREIILVNNASFVSHVIPPIEPGESVSVNVTMVNSGTTTWTSEKGFYLGSQNPPGNTAWGIDRIDLNEADSVLPGDYKTFSFEITAPHDDDPKYFQWQMIQADSGWFGERSVSQMISFMSSEEYLDDCDGLSGWNTSGTLNLSTSDKKQGSSCLVYAGTSADEFKKVFSEKYNAHGSEDVTMLQFWYYVSDVTKLTGKNQVELGSAGKPDTDEYNWNLDGLANGWNYIRLPLNEASKMGNPDLTSINWFRLYSFKNSTLSTKIDAIQLLGDGVSSEVVLTVNNGSGSGTYLPGDRILIQADTPEEGVVFDQWILNSGELQMGNYNSSLTFLTMSDSDAEVTANYVLDSSTNVHLVKQADFKIYPNPVQERLYIEFNQGNRALSSIAIQDHSGRVLMQSTGRQLQKEGDYRYSFTLGELLAGSYILKVCMDNEVISKMILIE